MARGRTEDSDRGAPEQRLERRAREVRAAVEALAREAAELLDVPLTGPDALTSLDLRLRLSLQAAAPGAPEPLLRDIVTQLRDARSAGQAYRAGHVHCFQCASATCAHSLPPDARSVFVAYSATGKPVWREFTEACLGWGVERIDSLFGEPPGVLAVARDGEALAGELIRGFGRGETSYRLLGQVACGYLPYRPRAGAAPERGALSVQIVGSRRGPNDIRLQLNVVGMAGDEADGGLPAWWDRRAVRDTIREAREGVHALSLRLSGRKGPIGREMREGVTAVTQRLRGDLERLHRPMGHRTQHARQRQREGDRPTHSALRDAERASDERLFFEPRRETVIVLGPKGRVHVFSEEGRHVTSLHHRRDAIERRLDRGQWVPCDAECRVRFRQAIEARLARDES